MRTTLLLSLVCFAGAASAAPILINNQSFEDPTLSPGSFFYSPTQMPGWSSTATGGADRGIWNTTATGKHLINIAFAYRDNAFAQQTTEAVQAGTTYTLTWLQGRTGNATRGTGELWAGGTLANGVLTGGTMVVSLTTLMSQDNMTEHSVSWTPGAGNPLIGQLLTVRFAGTTVVGESYVSFDNVRLDAAPVPEPATLSLLGLGALAAFRRRRTR